MVLKKYCMNGQWSESKKWQRKILAIVLLFALGILTTGTIRRRDDPIVQTQTNPILFKKKKEELKEGPKGAPQPVWRLYPKAKFLSEPPFEDILEPWAQRAEGAQLQQESEALSWEPQEFEISSESTSRESLNSNYVEEDLLDTKSLWEEYPSQEEKKKRELKKR